MVQMWLVPPLSQCGSGVYLSLNDTTDAFYAFLLNKSEWGTKKLLYPTYFYFPFLPSKPRQSVSVTKQVETLK